MSELNKMKPQLKSSAAARALIKRFEPFNGTAIIGDDGHWVVGYGHKAAAKPGTSVTPEEADLLLIYDVLNAETAIDDVVNTPLKMPQRDALVSFVHDIGGDAFKRSDVARYLFEGRAMAAGEALAIYGDNHPDRREAENALFMTAFAPPASRRGEEREQSTVELVIKVEHPEDIAADTPVEPALAEAAAAPAPADTPPPPSARDLAARRAAEDEISRILVAVGEMPLEALQAPVEDTPPAPPVQVPEARELTAAPAPEARPEVTPDATAEPAEEIVASIDLVQERAEPTPAGAADDLRAEAADVDVAEVADEAVAEADTAVQDEQSVDTPDDAAAETAQAETPDTVAQVSDEDEVVDTAEPQAPATPENYNRADEVSVRTAPRHQPRSVFDGYHSSPLAALMPEGPVRHVPPSETRSPATTEQQAQVEDAPEVEPASDAPSSDTSIPLSDVQSAVDTNPVDEAVHAYDVPADLSERADSGTASDPAAAQVIARMSQEIAAAQVEPREEHRGRASVQMYDESLPAGTTLGFVIAGELAAHFDEDAADASEAEVIAADVALDDDVADADPAVEAEFARLAEVMSEDDAAPVATEAEEPAAEAIAEETGEAELAAVVETGDPVADEAEESEAAEAEVPLAEMVEDVAAEEANVSEELAVEDAPSVTEAQAADEASVEDAADEQDTIVAQVHDVVEQAIAVAGQDAPPPHPAFEAATASGAVGEVGADASLTREAVHVEDELVDTGEIEALEDDFSPSDLAGEDDLYTDTRTIEPHKDRSAGWFILVLLAGLALSVYGGLFTYMEWDRVWGARELTSGAWALIAGSFFSVMALWQLLSIWMEKRKEKAPI